MNVERSMNARERREEAENEKKKIRNLEQPNTPRRRRRLRQPSPVLPHTQVIRPHLSHHGAVAVAIGTVDSTHQPLEK